ncbi:MAG: nuclear transport factor 2 family protein [Acidobacteriota bacterium]|nr:nuclear transport factor 2 family protein [Acidobacteriota bacterium]
MNENLATVAAIYEEFGKGDIPAILENLSDDVAWESWADNTAQKVDVPWLKARNGKNGVLEFFQVVSSFQFKNFQVLSLMAGGNQVAAELVVEAEIPATGGNFRDEEIHLWTFDENGRVIRFRHYIDTAKHIAAAEGKKTIA